MLNTEFQASQVCRESKATLRNTILKTNRTLKYRWRASKTAQQGKALATQPDVLTLISTHGPQRTDSLKLSSNFLRHTHCGNIHAHAGKHIK